MAENFLAPGVSVRELRAGVPQIRGTTTSVGAMVGAALRGPVDKAIAVDSAAKSQRIFGRFDPNSFLQEQVDAFFKNGGSLLWLVRPEPSSGGGTNTKATFTQLSGPLAATSATKTTGVAPFNLEPGQTVILDTDNQGADTATFDAAGATVTGSGASYAALTGLTVILEMNNDGDTQTATFTGGATDAPTTIAELNAQLMNVSVDDSGGEVRFTSDIEGTDSEIDITGGTALAAIGHAIGVSAGSGDVANIDAVTAAEVAALFVLDFSTVVVPVIVDNGDGTVSITSPTTGVASELDFQASTALASLGLSVEVIVGTASGAAANSLAVTAVGPGSDYNAVLVQTALEDNILAIEGDALTGALSSGALAQITVSAQVRSLVKVGDQLLWTDSNTTLTVRAVVSRIDNNTLVFETAQTVGAAGLAIADTNLTRETWNFTLIEQGAIVQGPIMGLAHSSLSDANYFLTRINTDNDENLTTVADSGATVGSTGSDPRPVNTTAGGDQLASGSTMSAFVDLDFIGNTANGEGLEAFNKILTVRTVAVPGVTGISVTGAVSKGLLDYCTVREDCVAVMAPPAATVAAAAVTYKNTNVGGTSYGIMYYPYVEIIGPLTNQKELSPPEGFAMGVMARTDRQRGVAKAPAGEITGRLIGTVGVEFELEQSEKEALYPANINPIENIEGIGQSIMGSRTMESGEFNQINVRRTFIFLKVSIQFGTRFVLFEPNDSPTRARVRRTIAGFLNTEWKKGTLEGDTLDEAFFVICDKSNNPETIINEGKMKVSIGVNIPRTTEFLDIEIQQDQRGVQAELGL